MLNIVRFVLLLFILDVEAAFGVQNEADTITVKTPVFVAETTTVTATILESACIGDNLSSVFGRQTKVDEPSPTDDSKNKDKGSKDDQESQSDTNCKSCSGGTHTKYITSTYTSTLTSKQTPIETSSVSTWASVSSYTTRIIKSSSFSSSSESASPDSSSESSSFSSSSESSSPISSSSESSSTSSNVEPTSIPFDKPLKLAVDLIPLMISNDNKVLIGSGVSDLVKRSLNNPRQLYAKYSEDKELITLEGDKIVVSLDSSEVLISSEYGDDTVPGTFSFLQTVLGFETKEGKKATFADCKNHQLYAYTDGIPEDCKKVEVDAHVETKPIPTISTSSSVRSSESSTSSTPSSSIPSVSSSASSSTVITSDSSIQSVSSSTVVSSSESLSSSVTSASVVSSTSQQSSSSSFQSSSSLEPSSSVTSSASSKVHSSSTSSSFIPQPTGKVVFAHFMMGNTFSYTLSSFALDIQNAKAMGFDGFTLNLGHEPWQLKKLDLMFQAAEQAGNFEVYPNFDMSVLPGQTAADAQSLIDIILTHYTSPAHARRNGKPLIGTFTGDTSTFGESSASDGWYNKVQKPLADSGKPIHFVPFFAIDASTLNQAYPHLDGIFKWNAWPYQVDAPVDDAEDLVFKKSCAASNKEYMAAVSPLFFTHFEWKNWIYRSEDTWYNRWNQIIKDIEPDMLQVISWNDYGESHHIGPKNPDATYPYDSVRSAKAWTEGYSHEGFASQIPFYINAYKTGSFGVPDKNSISLYHRTNYKSAQASDKVPVPNYASFAIDAFIIHSILKESVTINIKSSNGGTQSMTLPQGVNMVQVPFTDNMVGNITLSANTQCTIDNTYFNGAKTSMYNFNFISGHCEF